MLRTYIISLSAALTLFENSKTCWFDIYEGQAYLSLHNLVWCFLEVGILLLLVRSPMSIRFCLGKGFETIFGEWFPSCFNVFVPRIANASVPALPSHTLHVLILGLLHVVLCSHYPFAILLGCILKYVYLLISLNFIHEHHQITPRMTFNTSLSLYTCNALLTCYFS